MGLAGGESSLFLKVLEVFGFVARMRGRSVALSTNLLLDVSVVKRSHIPSSCSTGARTARTLPAWFLSLASLSMLAVFSIGSAGCVSLKTEHRVEPIHITMDVNVRLERELESAFSDLDARAREIAQTNRQEDAIR